MKRGFEKLILALALVAAVVGCNGEGSFTVIAPTPTSNGLRVSGQVLLPNGELAHHVPLWQHVIAALVPPVDALFAPSVKPVNGVQVQLVFVDPGVVDNGTIPSDLPVLATGQSDKNGNGIGQYEVLLPGDTNADRCRYMVQVGNSDDGTLTRAFVFRSDGPVNIDFASETVVRQILAALHDGTAEDLCDFESGDIETLYQAVRNIPGTIPGDTIETVNANSNAAALADDEFQALLEDAALPGPVPPTHTPIPTTVPASTATRTITNTRAATATETVRPTRTEGNTPTRTPTVSVTNTRAAATATPTVTAPQPTATNTVPPPTATATPIAPTATDTPVIVVPTNTSTVVPPTTTAVPPTATIPPATQTPTRTPTGTPTETVTNTPTQSTAALNLGSVSGGAGMIVAVPVVLVGTAISAVSTDIEFDTAALQVVLVNNEPDCEGAPTLPANKRVVASLPSISGLPAGHRVLRVGVIGDNNNDPLPAGTLLSCRFQIDAAASLGPATLLNSPDASDALGSPVGIAGSDGVITVTAAPPSLDLDMVVGTVGEALTITATLHNRGQVISALSTDIAVGTAMLDIVLGNDQVPDCEVDSSIGTGTTPDKKVFASVVPDEAAAQAGNAEGASAEVLRVGVIAAANNVPIPDGPVFHCQLAVPADATPREQSLTHRPEGSSQDGMTIGLQGNPGKVSIVAP